MSTPVDLVTGACGFIGSHLCEALLSRGHRVVGLDAFTSNYDVAQKRANLAAIQKHAKAKEFELIEGNIENISLAPLVDQTSTIYHLAGEPGVRRSWGKEFEIYLQRNIAATQQLLEAAKEKTDKPLQRFVFASSSSVYGERGDVVLTPQDYCKPFSPYGVTKLAAENLCMLYAQNFRVPCVALRLFTVFGPRQRADMAFHKFYRDILDGKPLVVFGDGKQSRDFTYVSDVVDAFMAAAERGTPGAVYNVGGGCPATVTDVLDMLRKIIAPRALNVRFETAQSGDVRHTRADLKATQKDLNYKPKVSLEDGLKAQWEWALGQRA